MEAALTIIVPIAVLSAIRTPVVICTAASTDDALSEAEPIVHAPGIYVTTWRVSTSIDRGLVARNVANHCSIRKVALEVVVSECLYQFLG